ncbi:MAG: transcriptional regulator [Bacteroidales bacterium]|nr:transcriptional regulator [Bacteroidales bacterium]
MLLDVEYESDAVVQNGPPGGHLKEQTGATSGNLSVQIDKLGTAGYITVEKGFKGKMPRTTCKITETGQEAFGKYVTALKEYLSGK